MTTVGMAIEKSFRNLNTLQMLKLGRVSLLALDGGLLLAIVLGAQVHRAAMRTVGVDAAPSIVAAQHIKAALADMDADEANEMLGRPRTANAATNGMAKRAPEADTALLEAARNTTYEAEKKPIETLQVTGGIYHRLVEQTEDLHDAQPDTPDAGSYVASPDVVNGYRADAMIMDNALLPAADDLDEANNVELQQTYHQQSMDSLLSTLFVVVAWLAVLGELVWMQMYLSRRTRRTVNPLLALSTLLLLGLGGYALTAMLSEQHQLKIAKEDSFDSVHALWRARAVAYQLKGEESRFLLDTARAGDYAEAFGRDANLLARLPAGMSYDELVSREARGEKVNGFTGYLADELNNITFKGEQQAAMRTLEAFTRYISADKALRGLGHDQAVLRSVSSDDDAPLGAFAQFDAALGETLAINQEEFERSVKAGLLDVGDLSGKLTPGEIVGTLEFKAVVLGGLVAGLIVMGFGPRIKEYD